MPPRLNALLTSVRIPRVLGAQLEYRVREARSICAAASGRFVAPQHGKQLI
jgi:hypothetical protein